MADQKDQALTAALGQIEKAFGKGAIMRMGDESQHPGCGDLDRLALARPRARGRRRPARAHRRDLRPGVIGQDDALLPHPRRGPEGRRDVRVHRRGALDGSRLCRRHRRRHRRAPRLAARLGRAGAGDLRAAGALGGDRHRLHRLGRGARAEGGARGRDRRLVRRHPGAAHEPGPAQAGGLAQPQRHGVRVHQPAAREDRRDVRLAGDDAGRPRAQVLRLRAPRHPAHRDAQGRRRGVRQPRARQGRQEQGRAALPPGRVRRHLRPWHLVGGHGAGRRHREGRRAEERLVPLVRGGAHRPGTREGQGIPAREPGCDPAHPQPHPGRLGGLDHPGRDGAAARPRTGRGRGRGAAGSPRRLRSPRRRPTACRSQQASATPRQHDASSA